MKRFCVAAAILLFTNLASGYSCADKVFDGKIPSTKRQLLVVCKERFAIGFDPLIKQPAWVAYYVTPDQLKAAGTPRAFAFKVDTLLPPGSQAVDIDFAGTDFDRGHLVPYEDVNDSYEAAVESFKYSNVSPQPFWYNRGIWKTLEGKVRGAAMQYPLYVVTGPIIPRTPTLMRSVPIPTAFWKVIVNPTAKTITTYIIPVQKGLKTTDLPSMLVQEAEVTKQTGIHAIPSRKRLTVMLK